MADTYKFALLRVAPDKARGEVVNVGLAVFFEDRIDVRIAPVQTKLRVVAPDYDVDSLHSLHQTWNAVAVAVRCPERAHEFVRGIGGPRVSELGYFCVEPRDYEQEVERIMRSLVLPPPRPPLEGSHTRIVAKLISTYRKHRIWGADQDAIDKHLVVHRYPVAPEENLYADFALRNGRLHITETIDFRATPETLRSAKRGQAALKAVTLDRADQVFKGGCVPIVVYAANKSTMDLVEPSLRLLRSYAKYMVDLNDRDQMAKYVQSMLSAARRTLPKAKTRSSTPAARVPRTKQKV